MADKRLTLGAAMHSKLLPQYRDWLLDKQRDLELQDLAWHEELDGDWLPNVDHIRQQLSDHTGRLGIHGPFQGLPLASYDSEVRAVVAKRMLKGLDYCAEIGATHMVAHSPFMFLGTPMAPNTTNMGQQGVIDLTHATLETVLPRAQEIGCAIVIETIFDRTPGMLLALVKSFDSEFVRLSIDTGHVFINYTQYGGAPLDYWVDEAGDYLEHVHIQDGDGHSDRHWVPGDGDINWRVLFSALAKLEQTPRMIIEIKDETDILRADQWFVDEGLAN